MSTRVSSCGRAERSQLPASCAAEAPHSVRVCRMETSPALTHPPLRYSSRRCSAIHQNLNEHRHLAREVQEESLRRSTRSCVFGFPHPGTRCGGITIGASDLLLVLAQPTQIECTQTVATCKLPPIFLAVRHPEVYTPPHTTLFIPRPRLHTYSNSWKTPKDAKKSPHRCEQIRSGTFYTLHCSHR